MSRLPTPTRTLVETSVGVREAARNLQKLSIHWESPHKVVIILKPDKSLIEKAQVVVDHLLSKKMVVYVEDVVYPSIKKTVVDGELRKWNANSLRSSISTINKTMTTSPSEESEKAPKTKSSDSSETPLFSSAQHAINQYTSATDIALQGKPPGLAHDEIFNPEDIDLVITLGGDGTVLYAAWLFQTIVPPVLPFHLGTLGFLTVFDFAHYKSLLNKVLSSRSIPQGSVSLTSLKYVSFKIILGTTGRRLSVSTLVGPDKTAFPLPSDGVRLNLRMRLTCAVYRSTTILSSKEPCAHVDVSPVSVGINLPQVLAPLNDSTNIPHPDDVFQILNDLVVDRGPSPYMSSLEVFGDGKHLTTVQADGLVVSTPTGSTAYSLSAGGSMVHPEVPAILVTPICPHTLSFRPMLLPDSMELKIVIPHDARSGAWASFDGRHRLELHEGDAIVVTASPYPVPTICRYDQTTDWFDSLGRCLRWNERAGRQKSFVWGQGVVEEKL